MCFHWSQCNRKSSYVSRTVHSILADLKKCFSLNDPYSFIDFFGCPFKAFRDRSARTNYKLYHCHRHVPELLYFSCYAQVLVSLLPYFFFHLLVRLSQLMKAAKYTACISAEGKDSPNKCSSCLFGRLFV